MLAKFLNRTVLKNGCLEWVGALYKSGYAQFWFEGKKQRGNRVVYRLTNGPIADGMVVRHYCDNKKCINPKHLLIGTQKDNMLDAKERKRFHNQKKTNCPNGHIYSIENTAIDKYGKRSCKTCCKLWMREKNGYNGFRKSKTDASQFPGVSYESRQKKWSARIKIDGKYKRLGMFTTEREAIDRVKEFIK